MDLFGDVRRKNLDRVAPLAVRMRPRSLEEFVGQRHFLGPGKLLRRMLEADRLTSVIFYGPPGTGKTTLAQLIATYTRSAFEQVNAAAVGVKEVRAILEAAKDRLGASGERTVLFLDEIHRFNRAQQDILLPDVEAGYVLLVGATTENPFFAVNSPLISRSQIFQFSPISEDDIRSLIRRAIEDKERGFGNIPITIDDDALNLWATMSDGDARRALMALEVAVLSMNKDEGGRMKDEKTAGSSFSSHPSALRLHITLDIAEQSIQRKAIVYDGTGDEHYDAASALIKSMRGSDPDAAVYWVARMLEAGEDPRFIARRIAILASEDIGNADPQAIVVAAAAFDIVEKIGMPEAQLTLGQAAVYMATAPKSNASAMAIWSAMSDVREGRTLPVPKHLRDTHYKGAKRLDHGRGYQYAHDFEGGFVRQDYLGVDKTYYEPTDRGYEAEIGRRLGQWRTSAQEPQGSAGTTVPDEPRASSQNPEQSDAGGPQIPAKGGIGIEGVKDVDASRCVQSNAASGAGEGARDRGARGGAGRVDHPRVQAEESDGGTPADDVPRAGPELGERKRAGSRRGAKATRRDEPGSSTFT